MKAAVVGATGAVGTHVVRGLVEHPQITEVRTLGRRAPELDHPKLDSRTGDLSELLGELRSEPFDAYFCCLGTTMKQAGSKDAFRKVDFDYVVDFANAAPNPDRAGLGLVSSVGADAKSRNFYLRVKGEAEQVVGEIGFRALHIYRPGLLDTAREESRPGEQAARWAMRAFNPLLAGGLARYRSIPTGTVATAMVRDVLDSQSGTFVNTNRDMVRAASTRA